MSEPCGAVDADADVVGERLRAGAPGLSPAAWIASGEPGPNTVGMSMPVFSRTVLAVAIWPTSQPARVNGTHGAGAILPFSLIISGVRSVWPAPAGQTDLTPEMVNENGKIAPAPWVPYTRAGCDVGEVATANTVLENTGIDIPPSSARVSRGIQANSDNPGARDAGVCRLRRPRRPLRAGLGDCSASQQRACRRAADEPGGYSGFNGLFGAKYINPVIKPNGR